MKTSAIAFPMILAVAAAVMAIVILVMPDSAKADVHGIGQSDNTADSFDQPYDDSPIRVCVFDYSTQNLNTDTWRSTIVSWLNTTDLGYEGISGVSWVDAGSRCTDGNLYIDFKSAADIDGDGAWPVAPVSTGSITYSSTLRPDGNYHMTQAAIALNADTWNDSTRKDVHRQFTLFHEAGHALAVNHEGPVLSPVGFGIGPFTGYPECANEEYNCLASLYDVADYSSWDYDPVANTGRNLNQR